MAEEEVHTCIICMDPIKLFAIPGECGHNMFCWSCILKQRIKLSIKACPACKAESS